MPTENRRVGKHAGGYPGLRVRVRSPERNSPIPAAAPLLRAKNVGAFVLSVPAEEPAVRARFDALAQQWRAETEFASAPHALFMHPAYQEIIGLGPAVLPLILRDLAETHDHWFWALRAITGENPVPVDERGRVSQMAECWLEWGRAKGLL
jgi:hypothetical protein